MDVVEFRLPFFKLPPHKHVDSHSPTSSTQTLSFNIRANRPKEQTGVAWQEVMLLGFVGLVFLIMCVVVRPTGK